MNRLRAWWHTHRGHRPELHWTAHTNDGTIRRTICSCGKAWYQ